LPLTPCLRRGRRGRQAALSLEERENAPLVICKTQRAVCPTNLPNNRTCRRLFPLPVGEGQGEGNGIAARQSDSDFSRNCRTSRVLRLCRRIPHGNEILLPFARPVDVADF